ncbi:MAG: glycosyltransferase [archaeon]
MEPEISVVICERNSEKFIEECIESVMQQKTEFELIVVDDFSADKTKEKIRKLQEKYSINLIELKQHQGISRARNTGIKASKGKFIAFIDSDCVAGKNWLQELKKSFDEETVSVGGPNIVPENAGKKEKIFDELLSLLSGFGSDYVKNTEKITEASHNPSCNSMYLKKILQEMNGFNEKLSSNEDPEIDFRIKKAGKKIMFTPKAVVFHHRKDSFKKIFSQAFWFGLGRMQAIKIHPEMAEYFRLIPLAAILSMLLLLFYGILSGKTGLIFYFVSAVFFVLALISLAAVIKNRRFSFYYFFFLIAWFFGYGFGMLKGVVK